MSTKKLYRPVEYIDYVTGELIPRDVLKTYEYKIIERYQYDACPALFTAQSPRGQVVVTIVKVKLLTKQLKLF